MFHRGSKGGRLAGSMALATAVMLLGAAVVPACSSASCGRAERLVSQAGSDSIGPTRAYREVARAVEEFIRYEMDDKGLPAVSIALVEGREIVWASGFGTARPGQSIAAAAETIYRVGSLSELVTSIAVMQLTERGRLDLDAPVTEYLPGFEPAGMSGGASITLRHLMAHRAGLVREPPVGGYHDRSEPTLAETVESINRTKLVYEPGSRTKHSNAGLAIIGRVLELVADRPFERHIARTVLDPSGMDGSGFSPPSDSSTMAIGSMWTYWGRSFEAPVLQAGARPAGGLFAPVTDVGKLLGVLLEGGIGPRGRVLEASTLRRMFGDAGQDAIGFRNSTLEGWRRVGHRGSVHGFADELVLLPEADLGVAVLVAKDGASAVTERIADYALRSVLARKNGTSAPEPPAGAPIDLATARRLAGRYQDGDRIVELTERDGHLLAMLDGTRSPLRSCGEELVVDGPLSHGTRITPVDSDAAVTIDQKTFRRVPPAKPAPLQGDWAVLVGEYGHEHGTVYVLELDGSLWLLIDWFYFYPLREVSEDVFVLPDHGRYEGETVRFRRATGGDPTALEIEGVSLQRRQVGAETGESFRIEPLRPVEELRREALSVSPPQEQGAFRVPDLVELSTLDPSIRYDIRYATSNNFLGSPVYGLGKAFLHRPVAEALVAAHRRLVEQGYGLVVFDAYRPWYVTKIFWEATPTEKRIFVADPSRGSRHNRGAAIDVTLFELSSGRVVATTGGYDEMSDRSYPDYPGGTSLQRWHRELLRSAMESEAFEVYEAEWWHFDHKDWREYPILNLTFEELLAEPGRR
jgi:D-alanyl-D-alanine dipeptidase/CubicO group peptidase (beta-lactamase class C family)